MFSFRLAKASQNVVIPPCICKGDGAKETEIEAVQELSRANGGADTE